MQISIASTIRTGLLFTGERPFHIISTKNIIRFGRMATVVFLLILQIGCSKSNSTGGGPGGTTPPPSPPPVISSVLPLKGPKNSTVQISGSGFGSVIANVKVYFNGASAVITNIKDALITCTVPQGAGTGNIKVQVNSKETTGPQFTYVLTPTVSILAGSTNGYADGMGAAAQFGQAQGLTVDSHGNIYVADYSNNLIRKISPTGLVTTFAGLPIGGYQDGPGTSALFAGPTGVYADAQDNIYVADTYNYMIRKISSQGVVSTIAGQAMLSGNTDGTGSAAQFYNPSAMCIDLQGNLLLLDIENFRIRKITPLGVVTTVAGTTQGYLNGPIAQAQFGQLEGICIDATGNIYVSDFTNNVIRKISTDGNVTTLAGNGQAGNADGVGSAAQFSMPSGMCITSDGNLLVADIGSGLICQVNPSSGLVTRITGTDPLLQLYDPLGVCIDSNGDVYVMDTYNYVVKKIHLD